MLEAVCEHFGIDATKPWRKLSKRDRDVLLYGSGDEQVYIRYKSRYGRKRSYYTYYEGAMPWLQRRHDETESEWAREKVEEYMREIPCPACKGARLKPESLAVTVGGANIAELCSKAVKDALAFIDTIELNDREGHIAERVLKEIRERLGFLVDVGLDYLTVNRAAATLAGGEAQRIRLATQIGSGLVGVLYILDEPSIGLHQRDNQRLIKTLIRLRDIGNTLVVVEHDEETVRTADYVVDIGPGAGEHGGEIVYAGELEGLLNHKTSLTGQYLSGRREIPTPAKRRTGQGTLAVTGPTQHNLKGEDASFRLGTFNVVTGVSGSGKSTLVHDILYEALMRQVYHSKTVPGKHKKITGIERLDKVILIDQSPIGRTPRSNPATYTGVFDHIRKLFAQTPEAKMRGYNAGPVLVQRPGRTLRGVRGRRADQDRDALPPGRLRPVRGVQGQALQPRDARGEVEGTQHLRDPRDVRRGSEHALRSAAAGEAPPADARRRRSRVRAARTAGDDVVRR